MKIGDKITWTNIDGKTRTGIIKKINFNSYDVLVGKYIYMALKDEVINVR